MTAGNKYNNPFTRLRIQRQREQCRRERTGIDAISANTAPSMEPNFTFRLGQTCGANWFKRAKCRFRVGREGDVYVVKCKYRFLPVWVYATSQLYLTKDAALGFVADERAKRKTGHQRTRERTYEESDYQ